MPGTALPCKTNHVHEIEIKFFILDSRLVINQSFVFSNSASDARGLHPAPRKAGWDAKHILNHNCWRHVVGGGGCGVWFTGRWGGLWRG